MKFSRDAVIPRIPAPHLLKQGQLQLAGASFRDQQKNHSRSPEYLLKNISLLKVTGRVRPCFFIGGEESSTLALDLKRHWTRPIGGTI